MKPLDNPLTTHWILMGLEISMEPYLIWQLGCIDDRDHRFGHGSVLTWTWTGSGGLEPLLTLNKRQLLPEVRAKASCPWFILAKILAQIRTATLKEVYTEGNMTAHKDVQFQLRLSYSESIVTTRIIATTDRNVNWLWIVIDGMSLNRQIEFLGQISFHLIKFTAWWQAVGLHEWKITIEQHIVHFGYGMMHLGSNISESIQWMCSADNVTTNISEWQYISSEKEVYWSANEFKLIQQMLKQND